MFVRFNMYQKEIIVLNINLPFSIFTLVIIIKTTSVFCSLSCFLFHADKCYKI